MKKTKKRKQAKKPRRQVRPTKKLRAALRADLTRALKDNFDIAFDAAEWRVRQQHEAEVATLKRHIERLMSRHCGRCGFLVGDPAGVLPKPTVNLKEPGKP